jgi:hypothetical protein
LPYLWLPGKFNMPTLTVTAKGQITLKQDLLKHLGVTPGQKIEVHKLLNGKLMLGCHVRDGDIDDFILYMRLVWMLGGHLH